MGLRSLLLSREKRLEVAEDEAEEEEDEEGSERPASLKRLSTVLSSDSFDSGVCSRQNTWIDIDRDEGVVRDRENNGSVYQCYEHRRAHDHRNNSDIIIMSITITITINIRTLLRRLTF